MRFEGRGANVCGFISAIAIGTSGCSQGGDASNHIDAAGNGIAETAAVDRCSTVKGSTGYGRIGVTAWFQGTEDGIESDVAGRITANGGFHLEDTLEIGNKCFVTARLNGIDNGSSYQKYFRCAIQRIYRDEQGDLLISSADNGTCEPITSPRDAVSKDVSDIPTVDILFGDIATGDVIEAMRVAGKPRPFAPTTAAPPPATAYSGSTQPSAPESASVNASGLVDQSATLAPLQSPAEWVNADDYPPSASRAGEEGRVAYALEVNGSGRVANCEVMTSSKSKILDDATCRVVTRRARFSPQRLKDGTPVQARYIGSISWKRPA